MNTLIQESQEKDDKNPHTHKKKQPQSDENHNHNLPGVWSQLNRSHSINV